MNGFYDHTVAGSKRLMLLIAALGLLALGAGCSDKSADIPTSWDSIAGLMQQGWEQYAAGDFEAAQQSFLQANQRNAWYLPSYDGLGWCAVRLTDFADAGVQFSFITTLADPATQTDLLADAYAGLCLSATIERSVLEISGEGSSEQLQDLALESIQMADSVFDLLGENYQPLGHDPGFGSAGLHLLSAQNYFYLQEFELAEEQLAYVDPTFVDSLLTQAGYGSAVSGEDIELSLEIVDQDSLWFLIPAQPGIHHYTEIVPPDSSWQIEYSVIYDQNEIKLDPAAGVPLQPGLIFTVSYVYIEDFAEYLYQLGEHIQELIEF